MPPRGVRSEVVGEVWNLTALPGPSPGWWRYADSQNEIILVGLFDLIWHEAGREQAEFLVSFRETRLAMLIATWSP